MITTPLLKAIVLASLLVTGCRQKEGPFEVKKRATAELEQCVERVRAEYSNCCTVWYSAHEVNSLVSPFVGTIRLLDKEGNARLTSSLVYQGGRWVITETTTHYSVAEDPSATAQKQHFIDSMGLQ